MENIKQGVKSPKVNSPKWTKRKLAGSAALILVSSLAVSSVEAAWNWNPWSNYFTFGHQSKKVSQPQSQDNYDDQKDSHGYNNSAGSIYRLPSLPYSSPDYFSHVYAASLQAPLPYSPYSASAHYSKNMPEIQNNWNMTGVVGTYVEKHQEFDYNNAFFQSLGENGRSCATCHEAKSAMSVSVASIRSRYWASGGKDPIFAPVDGANCPNLVSSNQTKASPYGGFVSHGNSSFEKSHSLLLTKGLFRIFLPIPDDAEFTVEVVSDPTTCNTDSHYNQVTDSNGNTKQIVSVFRRPIMSANLRFKTDTIAPGTAGHSGNIMTDGREPSLRSQAISATLGHAQALQAPTEEQVDEIVAFERSVYTAQIYSYGAGSLASGVHGGPQALSKAASGVLDTAMPFDEFSNWKGNYSRSRASIARGQEIFNSRTFTVSNVSGFNDAIGNNEFNAGTCGTCHNAKHAGTDALANAQRDIGVGGQGMSFGGPAPAQDLPIFRLTCKAGYSHPFNSPTILTNDPGLALITGKCADIGAKTVQGLRALAARAPYFSDGSAASLWNVVDFYDQRFNIGLNYWEKADLVHFLEAL